jgi:hypothetical protein
MNVVSEMTMKFPRFVGLIDLGIAAVVVVAVVLPAREMYASAVIKGDDAAQFAIALDEARTMATPANSQAVEDLERRLSDAGQKDWAIETAVSASDRAKTSPTRWRALLAASVAYIDRLDAVPGLDYANRALSACHSAQESGDAAACPSWEEVRMTLYQKHLDAGVKSGIDPRHDPIGFRKAGESALLQIHLGTGHDKERTGSASTGTGSARTAP